jgi:hypothetical protein
LIHSKRYRRGCVHAALKGERNMPDAEYNIAGEQAILDRLAQAHQKWRANRPTVVPQEDQAARLAQIMRSIQHPEPPDVVAIRQAQEDPLEAAIGAQLSIVGWRLYAKGGAVLLTSVYSRIELDRHPAFVWAVGSAWQNIGFSGDPRGI